DAVLQPEAVYCPARAIEHPPAEEMRRLAVASSAYLRVVEEHLYSAVSDRRWADGWLAVFPAWSKRLPEVRVSSSPLVLVCSGLEKPGNLGAILRTADAAGAELVIAAPAVTDWGNPNLVQASEGAAFSLSLASSAVEDAVAWLKERSIAIIAASAESGRSFRSVDYNGGVALVLGSEAHGLGDDWRAAAAFTVSVPMLGRVDS